MASTTSASALPKPDLGNWVHLLAFGFGSGCSPKAPGTMGTLLAVGIYLPLARLSHCLSTRSCWLGRRAARDMAVRQGRSQMTSVYTTIQASYGTRSPAFC
jgi:phosphatidylglycerophosphatase A